ncbi:hypothetical protein C2S52_015971 [Perilla frutescens var. hirtella]|nr:hypothetical protein C2S52_015971 [Perilla frutescens var. hirtella]
MNVNDSRRAQTILGVKMVEKHDIYLGLPTISCRSKRIQFGYLRDRALKKLASWKNKLLSAGDKEVLIKSVI